MMFSHSVVVVPVILDNVGPFNSDSQHNITHLEFILYPISRTSCCGALLTLGEGGNDTSK